MELAGLVGVVMLSIGVSLAGARAMLAAGLFLMTRAATARAGIHEHTTRVSAAVDP